MKSFATYAATTLAALATLAAATGCKGRADSRLTDARASQDLMPKPAPETGRGSQEASEEAAEEASLAEEHAAEARATEPFTEPLTLGGQTVSPQVLNEGQTAYLHYCRACHGENGDGRGPAASGMRPPPRNLTTGLFKFGAVSIGSLPNDEDLMRLLQRGLTGTPMKAWDMSDRERHAIVQFIKTFSPRWAAELPGDRIQVPPDPWKGREAEAQEVGKRIYHLSGVQNDSEGNPKYFMVGCANCHPRYIDAEEKAALEARYLGSVSPSYGTPASPADLYRPSLRGSEYTVDGHNLKILPPDFLFHTIKNGGNGEALYRTIAAGVAGAAMPTWEGVLNAESLWALVHYVKSLIALKATPQGLQLREALMKPKAPANSARQDTSGI